MLKFEETLLGNQGLAVLLVTRRLPTMATKTFSYQKFLAAPAILEHKNLHQTILVQMAVNIELIDYT
jgi:hypothetical protein